MSLIARLKQEMEKNTREKPIRVNYNTFYGLGSNPKLDDKHYKFISGGSVTRVFTVIKDLGKGGFGKVQLVEDHGGELFALKHIVLGEEHKDCIKLIEESHRTIREIRDKCKGTQLQAFIAAVYECYYFHEDNQHSLFIVSEYYKHGSLDKWLAEQHALKLLVPDTTVSTFVVKAQIALNILHAFDIIHRDISIDNILISNLKKEDSTLDILLNDFDLVRFNDIQYLTYVGKEGYRAPEIKTTRYTKSVDIYALGIVAFELMTLERFEKKKYSEDIHVRISQMEEKLKCIRDNGNQYYSNRLIEGVLGMVTTDTDRLDEEFITKHFISATTGVQETKKHIQANNSDLETIKNLIASIQNEYGGSVHSIIMRMRNDLADNVFKYKRYDIIQYMIDNGVADVDLFMLKACTHGDVEMAKMMMKFKPTNMQQAIEAAASNWHPEVLKVLRRF